jgi:hypothetical protein
MISTEVSSLAAHNMLQHQELDTPGLVAIRDFLKKRSRHLRLAALSNKAEGVNNTPSQLWHRLIRSY